MAFKTQVIAYAWWVLSSTLHIEHILDTLILPTHHHNFENSPSMIFLHQKCLGAGHWLLYRGSISFEGKIMEGDNFQDHGGKDQCIYM